MKIKCNNIARPIVYGFELSEKEKAEFDYLDDIENGQFFRYKGIVYDIDQFINIGRNIAPHPQREGWENFHGYQNDSLFSGVLIKFVGADQVIAATYYC